MKLLYLRWCHRHDLEVDLGVEGELLRACLDVARDVNPRRIVVAEVVEVGRLVRSPDR